MTRENVIVTLREHMPEIRTHGVAALSLFGSLARGEERAESDVDILVEFNTPVSIFKFLDLKDCLERILGRPVDLVTREALKPQLRDRILAEAVSAT